MTSKRPARGARRAAVVAAAEDLFARKPYDDVYITEIAEAAGVAHGLLFYHFKDKRGLYLEVLRKMQAEIADLHTRRPGEDTSEQWLRGVIRRHIEYRAGHGHTMLALSRTGGQDPEVDKLGEQGRQAGVEFIRELLGVRGDLPPRVRVAVRANMGAVDEMIADWLAHDRDIDIDELVDLACTIVVTTLGTVCAGSPEIQSALGELSAAST
ncbi:TetR/AcrR family transcriptional regulator [Kibdelosporangium aridum]|nr:TetR/AcrR family transcriptional regulator [Kibdelosporangium aridum]